MTTYQETTSIPHPPMPTLGFHTGTVDGEPVHNRAQNVRPDCDLTQQLCDYFAEKLQRIEGGDTSIAVHPFRNHEAAHKDYEKWLRLRIPIQMEVVRQTANDGKRKVIFIPKLYAVRSTLKAKDKERVADMSNDGTEWSRLADSLGYVISTSTHYAPRCGIVMYGSILIPKGEEA